jgi:trk system potassium uptake protein
MRKIVQFLGKRPGLAILVSFLTIIFVGTICLTLPSATGNHKITSFIDAFFTATSAVCVTGLTVKNTATYFNQFGQTVILCLIQIGSLTIITAYVNIFMFFVEIKDKMIENAAHAQSDKERGNIFIISIGFTLTAELVIFLYLKFIARMEYFDAVFHSISAFANAGFSTYSESLIGYSMSLNVIIPIMVGIIVGGLGFPVWRYFLSALKIDRKGAKYKHYSLVVLYSTASLILAGFLLIYFAEGFGGKKEMLAAIFQSVTARTAGFNTVAINNMSQASQLILMALMFIGGAWGSTAGGIKIFTFTILALLMYSALWKRKHNGIIIFGRSIPDDCVRSVMLIFLISIFGTFIFCLGLIYTENTNINFALFETISALNNVGLTLGLTNHLSGIGKVLIIILMLAGRIGPLTLISKMREKIKQSQVNYPVENIDNLLV